MTKAGRHVLARRATGAAVALAVAASLATIAAAEKDLYEISKELTPVYEKPGVSFAGYDRVFVDTLGVADARVVPPPWVEGKARNPKKWELNAQDIRWLKKSYRTAMTQQIEAGGAYTVVDQSGSGVLILDVTIVSLTPWAAHGKRVETKGAGTLTMQVQLRDGLTGELLAIYEGEQDVGTEYQQSTRLNKEHNVNELFSAWGEKVKMLLDEARS